MKIKLFLCFFLFGVNVWGQIPETNPEETAKKKEINTLKKNGEAYYSDVYQEVTAEEDDLTEAQQRSKDMLRAHVVEVFSKRMGMSKEDVREIWAVMEKNCQNIVVKKGDLFRVFTYVMKNALNPNASEASEPDPSPAPEPTPKPVPVPVPTPEPVVKVDSVATTDVKVDTMAVVTPPTPAPVIPESKVELKPEPKPAPKPEPKPEPKSEPASEVEVPVLCQNIMAKGNFDKVYRYLKQEMIYQRLIYGSARKMQRHEKCYIVLTDKTTGAIVAVLDKGESERMNFVTLKMDHFRNYQGGNYNAIFVQEY